VEQSTKLQLYTRCHIASRWNAVTALKSLNNLNIDLIATELAGPNQILTVDKKKLILCVYSSSSTTMILKE